MVLIIFALIGGLFVSAVVVIVIMNMALNVDICAREHEEIFYDNELDM